MCPVNGIVARKLQRMDETLEKLRSLQPLTTQRLEEDWQTKLAVERALQVLVEIMIDVCQRLLSVAGQTPASSGRDAVERCVGMGALSDFEVYGRMVQFRNFVVHLYERVDPAIVVDIVNHRLGDFERFRDEVLAYARHDDSLGE